MRALSAISEAIWTVVVILFFAVLIRSFVFQPFVVEGSSMVPTFNDHDYLIVNKFRFRFTPPRRGDVIVFLSPTIRNTDFIKRVIGLPGEVVRIDGNQVFVNGQKLSEPYLNQDDTTPPSTSIERFLGTEEYWVMGDNRSHSSDSRDWGPLQRSAIIGQASITVFPRADFGLVAHPSYSLSTQ